jgi:hypothetical protein
MEYPPLRRAALGRRSVIAALILLLIAAVRAGDGAASQPDPGPDVALTPLVASALAVPQPVAGADNRVHLAYELLLLNVSPFTVRVDSVATLDAGRGDRVLVTLTGPALAAVIVPFVPTESLAIGPAEVSRMILDLTLEADAPLPARIAHRFVVTVTPPGGAERTAEVVSGATDVGRQDAVVVDPPLAGGRWLVADGCCPPSAHRNATLAVNGVIRAPERFAIDFIRLDAEGRLFAGPSTEISSYAYYGVPIHAAADGVVVRAVDGMPNQVPGSVAPGITAENAGGNHIVVDIGDGRFAFYGHMQPGSLRVRVGDGVTRGQVIGLLGNTGNSFAPHLHFHVMDGPEPVASNGLPYVFRSFESEGTLTNSVDDLVEGRPAQIGPALAGPHRLQLPMNNQIVDFGTPSGER